MPTDRRPRVLAIATAVTCVAILPPFMVASTGVLMRNDFPLSRAALGAVVTVFFATTASASFAGGRLADRIGAKRALGIAASLTAAALLGIAVGATSSLSLMVLIGISGLGYAIGQPAANLALAGVLHDRSGFTFGINKASVPLSSLCAGAAVPLLAVNVGWRWAFAGASVLAVLVASSVSRFPLDHATRDQRPEPRSTSFAPVVALTCGMAVAASTATAMGAFLVETAVDNGLSPGAAGLLLVVSSVAGIVTRLAVGWLIDRKPSFRLSDIALMVVIGAVGYAVLGFASTGGATVVAGLLGYAFGWGWPGLMNYALVLLRPDAPATASGILQTGVGIGSATGPLAFGIIASNASLDTAWKITAAAAVTAAAVVLVIGRAIGPARPEPAGGS